MEPQTDYAALIRIIRDEFELAISPLREDIRELKGTTYTKDMIDKMFELRDERIARLGQMGGYVAGFLGALWALLASLQMLHVIK